jgi:HEAT repeat protein
MGQLRQSDSALPKLLDHIKKRGPLRNTLLAILRDSGTADAQKALCDLLNDPDSSATDRADIVRDLSLVKTPTADTLQKLTALMHDPAVGAQAELGVGANAYELRDSAPELAQQAVGTLVQDLQQAPDDVQRRRALGALGNSGAESALPSVQPYLDSGSEATQVSATEALRRMPGAQIDLLLADQLRHSPIAGVRIAAADAIRYRDPTPPRCPNRCISSST